MYIIRLVLNTQKNPFNGCHCDCNNNLLRVNVQLNIMSNKKKNRNEDPSHFSAISFEKFSKRKIQKILEKIRKKLRESFALLPMFFPLVVKRCLYMVQPEKAGQLNPVVLRLVIWYWFIQFWLLIGTKNQFQQFIIFFLKSLYYLLYSDQEAKQLHY